MANKVRRAKKWIQAATRKGKRGALHRQLGIPEDETVPLTVLRKAAKKGGKLGRRARFALNVRGLNPLLEYDNLGVL